MHGQILQDRYRVVRRISGGAQGDVFEAFDRKLERTVAVKLMRVGKDDANYISAFRREAKITACFDHRNVVKVYDYDIAEDGCPFLIMEFLRGQTLDRLDRRLQVDEIRQFVNDIGWALDQAHQRGLVHRDLKPSNVMLIDRGKPDQSFVLFDLGIAKLASPDLRQSSTLGRLTMAGMGTPLYMSPEQVEGKSGDARSDVYSIASMLFEMLSGRAPLHEFAHGTLPLLNAVVNETPPRLSTVVAAPCYSKELDQLFADSLAKNPSARPATMNSFITQFLRYFDVTSLPEFDTSAALARSDSTEKISSSATDNPLSNFFSDAHEQESDSPTKPQQILAVPPGDKRSRFWLKLSTAVGIICSLSVALGYALFVYLQHIDKQSDVTPNQEHVVLKPTRIEFLPFQPVTIPEAEPWEYRARLADSETTLKNQPEAAFQIVGQYPEGMELDTQNGIVSWTPAESQGPATYTFSLVVRSGDRAGELPMEISVAEVNSPPRLTATGNIHSIIEDQAWELELSAEDADEPKQSLSYRLLDEPVPPKGLTIVPQTGKLQWRPAELHGPGEYPIRVSVSDSADDPLQATADLVLSVSEANQAPRLATIPLQQVREGDTWKLQVHARDDDLPQQLLSYRFAGRVPPGMTIDSGTGIIQWQPTERDGPGEVTIKVEAKDDFTPQATSSTEFRIKVAEVNARPTLRPIGMQRVMPGQTLSVTVEASDSDWPDNRLYYSLSASAPGSARIDSQSGRLTWTPTIADAGKRHQIGVRVTDTSESTTQNIIVNVDYPKSFINSAGVQLTMIDPGDFLMGRQEGDQTLMRMFNLRQMHDDFRSELPRQKVTISKAFYLGRHEITVAQFARFVAQTKHKTDAEKSGNGSSIFIDGTGTNFQPQDDIYWRDPGIPQNWDHPVVHVSWNDAVAFCRWLSRQEGITYRLPTEAEWEYACRAGTRTRFWNGNEKEKLTQIGNVRDASLNRRYPTWQDCLRSSDGHVYTSPVGSFPANKNGLHDMHGNVWEWCADWFGNTTYQRASVTDPKGPIAGTARIARGGCFY